MAHGILKFARALPLCIDATLSEHSFSALNQALDAERIDRLKNPDKYIGK